MEKSSYYCLVMKSETHRLRDWVLSAFSVVRTRPRLSDVTYPYQIITDPKNPEALFFANPVDDGFDSVEIEGTVLNEVPFRAKEALDIVEGNIPLTTGNIKTTYGRILQNMFLLFYPFGTKLGYINGPITTKFEEQIPALLEDNIPMEQRKGDRIYVDEYIRFMEAVDALTTYDHLFVSSGSAAILVVADEVLTLREQLIAANKDNLNDKTIEAKITEQLVEADKASFKGDEDSTDFLITGKSFNPTRKKQLIMMGGSGGFGSTTPTTFVGSSLADGWKKEHIHLHGNEARAGSYFRGKETQHGGADTKDANRIMMNAGIVADYCGTSVGKSTFHLKENTSKYIGLYAVNGTNPTLITKDNIGALASKDFQVHSPMYCKAPKPGYCRVCLGKTYSLLERGVGSAVTNIYDVYMYDKMGRMHGVQLVTVRLDVFKISC